ncbi:hypothetical protein ACOTWR_06205 [Aliarcobacter butzleri]|uniref:hypothetical protein n=1 Tax=Aliarcobacter butzleri TaxID=28197 RepID=UPI0021B4AB48|nr:hypothetical protein [Aliarcobacter butzleri]MCT7563169.1 hypothetical protein [Aliarcobacter butzleri]MCT7578644.1 hypothetical protein [Aliarcobacter butzleri]MCT7647585.1 hypothetical protein [Aliarcobacter butzleri]
MQNKLFLLFTLLLSVCLYAQENEEYIDLGVRGTLYEIKEKSFKDDIAMRVKQIDFDYWEKQIFESAEKSMHIISSRENCTENKTYKYDPTFIIDQDIIIPYTKKTLFKKGYKYNPLKENKIQFKKYQIFIDADDVVQKMLAVKYSNVADVFVVKGNVKNLLENNIQVYIYREEVEGKAFKVSCLPTIFAQDNFIFNVSEYKLNDKQVGEKAE